MTLEKRRYWHRGGFQEVESGFGEVCGLQVGSHGAKGFLVVLLRLILYTSPVFYHALASHSIGFLLGWEQQLPVMEHCLNR